MRLQLIAYLLVCLLFTVGCEKESLKSHDDRQENSLEFAKGNANKVTICHKGKIKLIPISALGGHLGHGDVQLIDEDGDGYVTEANACGIPVDCNDESAALLEVCETCQTLTDFFSNLNPQSGSLEINSTQLVLFSNQVDGALQQIILQVSAENYIYFYGNTFGQFDSQEEYETCRNRAIAFAENNGFEVAN